MFFFEDGQAKYGNYYHLYGEEAFWQLFLREKLSGTFSFSIVEAGTRTSSEVGPVIQRNPTDLLITALQYRDEFKGMMDELPDPDCTLRREKLNLDWSDPAFEDLRPVAETIWQLCYSSVRVAGGALPGRAGVRVEVFQNRAASSCARGISR